MEFEEWQGYVTKVANCDVPIPPNFINDYNNWHCRSIVGRMLVILHDIEGAMQVLSTVRDVEIDMEQQAEVGMSDAEHKCLCLRDLGEIVWGLTHNLNAAMYYFNEAFVICRDYKYAFYSAKRGGIWARRLEIMREAGKGDFATQKCQEKMAAQNQEDTINQYLFYGHKFLAENCAAADDYAGACKHLKTGFKYYPMSKAGEADLAQTEALENLEERYVSYEHCATLQYAPWEDIKVPTLEEVHQKQYDNYLKRKAAEARGEAPETKQCSVNPFKFEVPEEEK